MALIWKDVNGYEGLYQVSNTGQVKHLPKYKRNGISGYTTKERLLKQTTSGSGYKMVNLFKDSKSKLHSIHRLVALHFIDGEKETVNHINGNKFDNNVSNLEWATYSENNQHAIDNGLNNNKGENNNKAKMTNKDILDMRKLSKFFTNTELAKIFDIHKATVGDIISRKTWKHLEV